MNVRMANIHDMKTLIKVRFDYFDTENWEISNKDRTLMLSQLNHYYLDHLNNDFFAVFVEDENGCVVATAFLAISEKPANPSWPTGKTGMILNVLTYPQYRKKGYATQAMNFLIDEAKKQNCSYIELSASDLGKSLYKRIGFQEIELSHFAQMKLSFL